MVVGSGVAGVDKGHLVDMLREIGKQGGDGLAAFSLGLELEGALHEAANGAAEKPGEFVEPLQWLAVPFFERRLVVPGIHLAGATVDEKPDHRFGGRLEVRLPGGKRIEGVVLARGSEESLVLE